MEQQRPGSLNTAKSHMFVIMGQPQMRQLLWPDVIQDSCIFSGMLLMASIHLDGVTKREISPRTLTVKHDTMRLVRDKLPDKANTIQCIGPVACLAFSALVTNSPEGAATEHQLHGQVLSSLIKERSQQGKVGMSSYIYNTLKVIYMALVSKICGIPIAGFFSYPAVDLSTYEHIFGVWSPENICPQLLSPVHDEQPRRFPRPYPCIRDDRLRILVIQTRNLYVLWQQDHNETEDSDPNDLPDRSQLYKDLKSTTASRGASTDYIYESCRLTAELSILAFQKSSTWLAAAQGTSIVRRTRDAILKTDLGSLWGDHVGLLYWIVLIMQCASWGTSDYVFFHSIISRFYFELCYSLGDDWHGGIVPMVTLRRLTQAIQQSASMEP